MKHTKSMYYNPTTESKELFLFVTNDCPLYNNWTQPIIDNLKRKAKKGIYNSEKAVDLWYCLANAGSEKYNQYYGYKFNVTNRYTVAVELEAYYNDEVFYELNNK